MKTAVIILVAFVALFGFTGLSLFMMYQSLHDSAINWETTIDQKHGESEIVLSRVTVSVQQTAGVAEVYATDVKDTITAAIQGRYGKDGSKAVFQMITEKNPTVSNKLYLKLTDIIEGGQKEFEIVQKRKIEVCTNYKKELGYLVRGSLLKMADFPKIDLSDKCKIISDISTRTAFETGLQQPIKLR